MLPQICYVLSRVSHTAREVIHHSSHEAVLVAVSWSLDFLVVDAHLIQFFIVESKCQVRVFL